MKRLVGLAFATLMLGSCAESVRGVQRYDRDQLEASLAQPEAIGLEMGVFPLRP